MTNKPITINDIAKLLGLSKSTVSRALRDHPDISEETRERVKQVAAEFKYRPNSVAVSLRKKESKLIGIVVPQISYFFFPSVIEGIEKVAYEKGYNLIILQSNESYEREVENLEILIANNVEGILASVSRTTKNFSHFEKVIDLEIPLVFYDRIVPEIEADTVMVDDIAASKNAINYLINTGRKRIAIITGNLNLLISQNRLKGYKEAMKSQKKEIDQDLICSCEWPLEAESEVIRLFQLDNPPDAIFAISDLLTSGVMKGLYSLNKKIPEEVAVMAFCEEPFRFIYNPPITSIDPKGFEIGRAASEILFDRIENTGNNYINHKNILIQGDIVVKGSA